jgi:hypothetical protein
MVEDNSMGKITTWDSNWLGDVDSDGKVTAWDGDWLGDVDSDGKITVWDGDWLGDVDSDGKITAWDGDWLGDVEVPKILASGASMLLLLMCKCHCCSSWTVSSDLIECNDCSFKICDSCIEENDDYETVCSGCA